MPHKKFSRKDNFNKRFWEKNVVFFQLFVAPGDVPTPSWRFLLYIFYLQYYTAISPFLWFIAMRTRSGTGCFLSYLTRWREIETAILASYPSAAEALVLVLNRVRNSPRRTHRDDGTVTFYTLCAVDQSLIVHSLKGEATLPGSSQRQLEVCQSAVAKPPFERGFEAQLSSHHPLFLSPNSRVTVMSYQDRHLRLLHSAHTNSSNKYRRL